MQDTVKRPQLPQLPTTLKGEAGNLSEDSWAKGVHSRKCILPPAFRLSCFVKRYVAGRTPDTRRQFWQGQ